jgi:four helix bundle protein
MRNEELGMKNAEGSGENVVLEKSYSFALEVIGIHKAMAAQKEFVLSRQLLKSGTSIGANVEEAQAAQSRNDFLSKMSIACKEARETRYWLRLLQQSQPCPLDCSEHLQHVEELLRLLNSIVKTTSGKPR